MEALPLGVPCTHTSGLTPRAWLRCATVPTACASSPPPTPPSPPSLRPSALATPWPRAARRSADEAVGLGRHAHRTDRRRQRQRPDDGSRRARPGRRGRRLRPPLRPVQPHRVPLHDDPASAARRPPGQDLTSEQFRAPCAASGRSPGRAWRSAPGWSPSPATWSRTIPFSRFHSSDHRRNARRERGRAKPQDSAGVTVQRGPARRLYDGSILSSRSASPCASCKGSRSPRSPG